MSKETPYRRAKILLRETEERLQKINTPNLDNDEIEVRTQWLEARRQELGVS